MGAWKPSVRRGVQQQQQQAQCQQDRTSAGPGGRGGGPVVGAGLLHGGWRLGVGEGVAEVRVHIVFHGRRHVVLGFVLLVGSLAAIPDTVATTLPALVLLLLGGGLWGTLAHLVLRAVVWVDSLHPASHGVGQLSLPQGQQPHHGSCKEDKS